MKKAISFMKILFTLIFFCLVLASCNIRERGYLSRLETVLAKLDQVYAAEFELNMTATVEDENIELSGKMAFIDDSNGAKMYATTRVNYDLTYMYYTDGCIFSYDNGRTQVYEASFDESYGDFFGDLDMVDIDALEKIINEKTRVTLTENKDGYDIYSLSLGNIDISKIIPSFSSEIPVGIGEYTVHFFVDNKTQTFEKIEYEMNVTVDDKTVNINMILSLVAVNENVVIDIPSNVAEEIFFVKYPGAHYNDSADGIVTYNYVGIYENVLYDNSLDKFIVLRNDKIDIYNASFEKEGEINYVGHVESIDVDNGKIVLQLNYQSFAVYDALSCSLIKELETDIYADIFLDGNKVVYSSYDRKTIKIFDIETSKLVSLENFKNLNLCMDKENHILYAQNSVEGGEFNILFYEYRTDNVVGINLKTAKIIARSEDFAISSYNTDKIWFDGQNVHSSKKIYRGGDLALISALGYGKEYYYNESEQLSPSNVKYDSPSIALLGIKDWEEDILIYDNINEGVLYSIPSARSTRYSERFTVKSVGVMNNGNIFLSEKYGCNIAVVDMLKIPDKYGGKKYAHQPFDMAEEISLTISDDGKEEKLNSLSDASKFFSDGIYIYYQNKPTELSVLNVNTFEVVYSERFLFNVQVVDAVDGIMLLSLQTTGIFRVYNTRDWSYETIPTSFESYFSAIYNGKIIYMPFCRETGVFEYDCEKKEITEYNAKKYQSTTFAINTVDGVLYFGDTDNKTLTYFNLNTYKEMFNGKYTSNVWGILFFDGQFLHYMGMSFDKLSGEKIVDSNNVRLLHTTEYTNTEIVYDDDNIAIFSGYNQVKGTSYLLFYDLKTDMIIHSVITYGVRYTTIKKHNDAFFICNDRTLLIIRNIYENE